VGQILSPFTSINPSVENSTRVDTLGKPLTSVSGTILNVPIAKPVLSVLEAMTRDKSNSGLCNMIVIYSINSIMTDQNYNQLSIDLVLFGVEQMYFFIYYIVFFYYLFFRWSKLFKFK